MKGRRKQLPLQYSALRDCRDTSVHVVEKTGREVTRMAVAARERGNCKSTPLGGIEEPVRITPLARLPWTDRESYSSCETEDVDTHAFFMLFSVLLLDLDMADAVALTRSPRANSMATGNVPEVNAATTKLGIADGDQ